VASDGHQPSIKEVGHFAFTIPYPTSRSGRRQSEGLTRSVRLIASPSSLLVGRLSISMASGLLASRKPTTMTNCLCGDTSARTATSKGVPQFADFGWVTGGLRLGNDADITIAIGMAENTKLHRCCNAGVNDRAKGFRSVRS
jgi:hypothetical protein